ncbi:MAG: type II secretion system F family protein [Gammaproteobacteria bacterium]|nr:type II secretion system F family protein [Gammaproteobacteria bacterium]
MNIITKHFHWSGVDENGQHCQDSQVATNKSMLKQILLERNITLLSCKSQIIVNFRKKIYKKYIIEFIKQLSILLGANINLIDAIKILKREQQQLQLKSMLNDMQKKINAGYSLSQAILPLSHLCGNHINGAITAAEKTGRLPTLLKQLSQQLQQQRKIKMKVIAALYYPATILIAALLVGSGLLIFAIPQFKNIYANFGTTLPAFTQMMIKFSDHAQHYGVYIILAGLIFISIMLLFYKNSKRIQQQLHKHLLHIPIIRTILLDHNLGQWSQILGHSYEAGLPLIEAITLANKTLNNKHIQSIFNTIPTQLKSGNSLSQIIKQQPFLNSRQQYLLILGDESGELQQVLQNISQQCFERLQNTLSNLSKLLEPVIIMGIALICGSCIIAMYLPIFNIGAIV